MNRVIYNRSQNPNTMAAHSAGAAPITMPRTEKFYADIVENVALKDEDNSFADIWQKTDGAAGVIFRNAVEKWLADYTSMRNESKTQYPSMSRLKEMITEAAKNSAAEMAANDLKDLVGSDVATELVSGSAFDEKTATADHIESASSEFDTLMNTLMDTYFESIVDITDALFDSDAFHDDLCELGFAERIIAIRPAIRGFKPPAASVSPLHLADLSIEQYRIMYVAASILIIVWVRMNLLARFFTARNLALFQR